MILNCKQYADEILDKVSAVPNKKALAVVSIGDDEASKIYIAGKRRDCERCGIPFIENHLEKGALPYKVNSLIEDRNYDPTVAGVILQLPTGYDDNVESLLTQKIRRIKDVDGFRDGSLFDPCTPEGILYIIRKQFARLSGLRVCVVGRGKLVGKPLAEMLLKEDCTVTIAHSKSRLYNVLIRIYDVVVLATDKPHLVNADDINASLVIDAGIARVDGKVCGNVKMTDEAVKDPNRFFTPVPGGVGLMTRAVLMAHVAKASDPTFTY